MHSTNRQVTAEEIKQAIGYTWFDLSDEGGFYCLSSRQYGNVGDEEAGDPDIQEARRIAKVLRPLGYRIEGDIVDEWVSIQISKEKQPPTPNT